MIKRFENGKCSIRSSVEHHFPNISLVDCTDFFLCFTLHSKIFYWYWDFIIRPLIIAYGIWAVRDLCCATLAATLGLCFCHLIRRNIRIIMSPYMINKAGRSAILNESEVPVYWRYMYIETLNIEHCTLNVHCMINFV